MAALNAKNKRSRGPLTWMEPIHWWWNGDCDEAIRSLLVCRHSQRSCTHVYSQMDSCWPSQCGAQWLGTCLQCPHERQPSKPRGITADMQKTRFASPGPNGVHALSLYSTI